MKDNYTHISFVLDRSGSMKSIKEDTIGGFNEFLEAHQKAEGAATVTLVQFDDQYEIIEDFTDVKAVKLLTEETFVPRSSTALNDAIGVTIAVVGKKLAEMDESERPSKVLVCVLTDGYENSSIEYTTKEIKKMVETQTNDYNWEFVFIGANQDAVLTSEQLGFQRGKTIQYAANDIGTRTVFNSFKDNSISYRASGQARAGDNLNFSDEQYKKQKEAGV